MMEMAQHASKLEDDRTIKLVKNALYAASR